MASLFSRPVLAQVHDFDFQGYWPQRGNKHRYRPRAGELLRLVREPDNPKHKNAVAIHAMDAEATFVAYLPWELADVYVVHIEAGDVVVTGLEFGRGTLTQYAPSPSA